MELENLFTKLYSEQPSETLFHYTSLAALQGIIQKKCFWAGDIRYLNDAAELRHAADLIKYEIDQRINRNESNDKNKVLNQLKFWINHRLNSGHSVFVVSFTENGNLLSQWRAYCPHGKGLSIGLEPNYLRCCAVMQSFRIGKCIYDYKIKKEYLSSIIDYIEALALKKGEALPSERHPSQCFDPVFELCEDYLLQICVLFKHASFAEEEEWRLVSPIIKNYNEAPILYRDGKSMLLPFIEFYIDYKDFGGIQFDKVYLGPSNNAGLSMISLGRFLSKSGVSLKYGLYDCQIPYREK